MVAIGDAVERTRTWATGQRRGTCRLRRLRTVPHRQRSHLRERRHPRHRLRRLLRPFRRGARRKHLARSSEIPDQIAAIFDPLGNAVHTVMAAGVSGKSVLITGVGIIGLMAVTVARAAGAGKILVTDWIESRLELAKQLGADEAFRRLIHWVEDRVRELTHGNGPHVMLEMSGNPHAIRDGFRVLRNGGTAAMLGIPADDGRTRPVRSCSSSKAPRSSASTAGGCSKPGTRWKTCCSPAA